MSSQEKYIIGYMDFLAAQFRKQRDQTDTQEADIQKYDHWLSLIDNLKTKFQWQILSSEEKQFQRVAWLKSLHKRGLTIEKQLSTLELYDAITASLPFMKAYDTLTQVRQMVQICEKELLIIDYSGRGFGSSHVSLEDYRSAFSIDLAALAIPDYTLKKIEVVSSLFKVVVEG